MEKRNADCFFLEETTLIRVSMRRYESKTKCPVKENHELHSIKIRLPTTFESSQENSVSTHIWEPGEVKFGVTFDDPRWSTPCACGFQFDDDAPRQMFVEALLKRQDTGELMTTREAGHGAMWFSSHYAKYPNWCGPDGRALMVKILDHEWHVDGGASNCTKPNDREHRCWIRHGTPPNITVDKNGNTCNAGGGSIWVGMNKPNDPGSWHGFLRNGRLEEC